MSSEKHPNLQLHKWAPTDYVKREEWNENFGIIDDKIGILSKNYLSVFSYGAKGDGIQNDAPKIQDALNDAAAKGIRTVVAPYTPTGYKIDTPITIPKGVLLIGTGSPSAGYLSGGAAGAGIFTKTYFIMDGYTGTPGVTQAAITLADNSGIERIGFYYKTVNTQITSGDVPTFPWTIYGSGYGLHLKDLSVMGASHFISIGAFERGYIDGIYGLVTKMAFRIKRSRDISRILNVHINPNLVFPTKDGATSEGFSAYFTDLLKNNLVVFRMGSADFYFMENIMSWGSNKFFEVVPNNYDDGLGEVFDNYTFTVAATNIAADNTKYGLYIQRPIAFTAKFTNLEIVPIHSDGQGVAITMTGGASGMLSITNFESKGTTGQTAKHVVLNSTGVSVVDIKSGRFIFPGSDSNRSTFTDMFDVQNDNKLTAEILFSKTNSNGKYRTVIYDSDATQYPRGFQIDKYSIEEDTANSEFKIYRRDGADAKTTMLTVDNIGGLTGGFGQLITNGTTATYDMRSTKNINGRGVFIVSADYPGNAFVIGYSNGSALTAINVGADATCQTTNAGSANKLNVFLNSSGVLGIQNNLGSDRNVTVIFFPSIR
jgi:hypothetical protein